MKIASLKLDFDENKLKSYVITEYLKKLNSVLFKMSTDGIIKRAVGIEIRRLIENSPEYDSLISGKLNKDFGLDFPVANPTLTLNQIIETIERNVEITFTPAIYASGTVRGSLTISVLKSDFSDVLAIPSSQYNTEKGELVPWLRWLLLSGDSVVVAEYDVVATTSSRSRAGGEIMKKSFSGYRVPPEYSGTATNNWLTRALEDLDILMGNILQNELSRRI
jgi:hypothetical protein